MLDHFRSMLRPGGAVYVSTPNVLTLAPPGAEKSDNPWHLHEYRAEEFRALCEAIFDRVELLGLFHARKLRLHELAMRAGWDRLHPRLGLTEPLLRLVHAGDLGARLRAAAGPARRGARLRRRAAVSARRDHAARARPSLPHALRRGLRHLAVRRGVAVGGGRDRLPAAARRARRRAGDARPHAGAVRPARDAPGRGRRPPARVPARHPRADPRRGRARPGARAAPRRWPPRCAAPPATTWRAERALEERGRDVLGGLAALEGVELWTSAATPRGAAAAGHRRRPAAPGGHRDRLARAPLRRLGRRLLAARVRVRAGARATGWPSTACARSASTRPSALGLGAPEQLEPVRTEAGPVAVPIDWADRRARLARPPRLPDPRASTATTTAARSTTSGRGTTAAAPTTTRWRSALAREHARDFVAAPPRG